LPPRISKRFPKTTSGKQIQQAERRRRIGPANSILFGAVVVSVTGIRLQHKASERERQHRGRHAISAPEYLERLQLVVEQVRDKFPDLRVEEGLLFKKTHFNREESGEFEWKLWIPEALTTTLIQQAHGGDMAMHGGMAKTLARLQQMYYWP